MTSEVPTGLGPLAGLRVIDLTDDLGRFGTKLLAEAGAHVVRAAGRGERGVAMADPDANERGGVLQWWYDAGKTLVPLDLDTEEGRGAYRALAQRADLIVEAERPGRLAAIGLDHADLVDSNPRLTQVSITPYGRTGPWSQLESSDLVAGALGGVLSITG
ncbi:MAG: CoA transferase, partial [Actinomycetota bacterium]|nr:CoA transferase [Actinomycetota bacterium]